jgi:hypothetical protein
MTSRRRAMTSPRRLMTSCGPRVTEIGRRMIREAAADRRRVHGGRPREGVGP